MAQKIIIGLAGRKASGKTTAARFLVNGMDFHRLSFADPLRDMVGCFLLGMGYGADYIETLLTADKEQMLAPIGKTPRQLLQTLGTEWGRDHVDRNVWVTLARRRINTSAEPRIIFDDVRFENEAAMIRGMGGQIIHIDRGDLAADSHASEHGIDEHDADLFVDNDTTVEEFLRDVELVVESVVYAEKKRELAR